MLTRKDEQKIEEIVERVLDEKLEEKLEEKFEEKLKFLPTKDEFYEKMDEVIGEIKAMREELTMQSGRISEHSDQLETHEVRIDALEDSVNKKSH